MTTRTEVEQKDRDAQRQKHADIVNMAMHPTKASRPLPRSRWRRALLVLHGYELYGP